MVVDKSTRKPIELVTIQEKGTDRGAVTDKDGRAELKGFSEEGSLILRHPDYEPILIKFISIKKNGFIAELSVEASESDEAIASANKWEQRPEEIPQQIVQFKRKSIALAEPATMADLLGMNSQVFIQSNQQGGGNPMIRGYAGNGVLISIDGIRMNNAIFGSDNLQHINKLDPAGIEQAELMFGPASVAYGSDALGGVMNFRTKTPSFSDAEYLGISTGGFARYASASGGISGNYHIEFNLPNFASFTGVSYSRFGDLRTGSHRPDKFPDFGKRLEYIERQGNTDVIIQNDKPNFQRPSGYDQYHVLQKFRWRMGSFADFSYACHYSSSSDIHRYDRLTERDERTRQLRYAESYYGPQLWQMHAFTSNFTYPNTFFDRLKLTTAIQLMEESRHERIYTRDELNNQKEKVNILSVNADALKSLGFSNELYYGLELVTNEVESTAYSKNIVTQEVLDISTKNPDGGSKYNTAAAYFSVKNSLGSRLTMSTGLRYTFTRLRAKFDNKTLNDFPFEEVRQNHGALTGNLGLVFQPGSGWKLGTLFSTGFRAPNINDVSSVYRSSPGNLIVPNAEAKPEYNYNFEYSIGRSIKDRFSFSFVNYYSFLRDALVQTPAIYNGQSQIFYDGVLSNVYKEQNIGKAYIWGMSLNGSWILPNGLSMSGAITFTEGEDSITKEALTNVPPIFGELGMGMTQGKLSSIFKVKFSGGIAFEDLAPSEQAKTHLYTTDGALPWYTINIYNSYKFNDYYSLNFNLENLLDTHYRPYASAISAPGFNAVISFRASF